MNLKIHPAILEATRLVRDGSVLEATRAIQRALGGRVAPSADDPPAAVDPQTAEVSTIEGSFREIEQEARCRPAGFS